MHTLTRLTEDQTDLIFPEGLEFNDQSIPVDAYFFPHVYDKVVGKKAVLVDTTYGTVKMKPLLNGKIREFLDGQGPGCTEAMIPMYGTMQLPGGEHVVVYFSDMDTTCLTIPVSEFDKEQVLDFLVEQHIAQQYPDEEEYED